MVDLRARHRLTAVIPTASIADIAFLLIIYFMVTVVGERDRTRVELPESTLRFKVPVFAEHISVNREGKIRLSIAGSCDQVFRNDPLEFLATRYEADPGRAVILKADAAVPYRHVDQVLDALRRARFTKVYFQTRQKVVDESAD